MVINSTLQVIDPNSDLYPTLLIRRLSKDAPTSLWVIGCVELMSISKTALFCSKSCPGEVVLKTMDQAQKWRDQGRCIISGFHSPIEKECLQILMRGRQPIIICPARSIENMRIPKVWKLAIDEGRLLLLSLFPASERRITATLAEKRNQMVAALAEEVFFAYITPKGRASRLSKQITKWGIPICGN